MSDGSPHIETVQDTPVPADAPPSRVRMRTMLLPAGLVAVIVIAALVNIWFFKSNQPEEGGLLFVIPAGASESIDVPTIDTAIDIPIDIRFGPDDVAVITVRNDDLVAHRAGPWVVGPGQTYTARFDTPGEYSFACSVDRSKSVTVTVTGE